MSEYTRSSAYETKLEEGAVSGNMREINCGG